MRSFFFRSIFGPLLRLFGGAPFWPRLALGIRRASRSNSCEEICETSPPSSAATTFSTEPSKNVSTRCRSAVQRRGGLQENDIFQALLFVAEMPFFFEDAELCA